MSKSSREKACTQSQTACRCGQPTQQQIDAAAMRLIQDNPGWRLARCAQRARVEVYIGSGFTWNMKKSPQTEACGVNLGYRPRETTAKLVIS